MLFLQLQLSKLKAFAHDLLPARVSTPGIFLIAAIVGISLLAPHGALAAGEPGLIGSLGYPVDMWITNIIYLFAVAIPSMFAFIASAFLGIAVNLSLDGATYGMGFVTAGWTVSRDIANMAFLFILIYIAFSIMLNLETGGMLQTLAWVIAIAMLVNFSFFFSRLVVDAGNIVALQFYNAIPDAKTGTNPVLEKMGVKDMSDTIMSAINFQEFLGGDAFKKWNEDMNTSNGWSTQRLVTLSILYIALGIIIITLSIAFFVAGVHFLGRIVVLWLLIMVAPLAFVAQAIPNNKIRGYFSDWREALFKHAFFPAFFLFVFLFLTVFLRALMASSGTKDVASMFLKQTSGVSGDWGFLYTLGVNIAVITVIAGLIILLIQKALQAGDSFGLATGKAAGKVSGWLNKSVVGNYKSAVTSPLRGAARGTAWGAKWVGGKAYQKYAGGTANALSKNIEGRSWGYSKAGWILRRDILKKVEDKQVGTARSFTSWKEDEKLRTKSQGIYEQKVANVAAAEEWARLDEKERTPEGLSASEKNRKRELTGDLQRLNSRELEEVEDRKSGTLKNIAGLLTSKQLEAIRRSDKVPDIKTKEISDMWHERSSEAPLAQIRRAVKTTLDLHSSMEADLQRELSSLKLAHNDIVDATRIATMAEETAKATHTNETNIAAAHNVLHQVQSMLNDGKLEQAVLDAQRELADANKAAKAKDEIDALQLKVDRAVADKTRKEGELKTKEDKTRGELTKYHKISSDLRKAEKQIETLKEKVKDVGGEFKVE